MLFVVKRAEESESAWRILNARDRDEARAQALAMADGRWIEYGEVNADTGAVSLLGCVRDPSPRRAETGPPAERTMIPARRAGLASPGSRTRPGREDAAGDAAGTSS